MQELPKSVTKILDKHHPSETFTYLWKRFYREFPNATIEEWILGIAVATEMNLKEGNNGQ